MPSITTVTYSASVAGGAGSGSSGKVIEFQSSGNQLTVASTDRVTVHSIVLPDSTTDKVVDLGELASVAFLWIKSTQAITLQVNAGAGEIRGVNPFYCERFPTNATALYLTNASGADASVDIVLVGPAT